MTLQICDVSDRLHVPRGLIQYSLGNAVFSEGIKQSSLSAESKLLFIAAKAIAQVRLEQRLVSGKAAFSLVW